MRSEKITQLGGRPDWINLIKFSHHGRMISYPSLKNAMSEVFTLWNAQKLYVVALYGWALYVYADSCYSTANRVYRLANGTYCLSSSAYSRYCQWRAPTDIEMVTPIAKSTPTTIEMSDTRPLGQIVQRLEPPCVIDYFTEGQMEELPPSPPKLVRQNGMHKNIQ